MIWSIDKICTYTKNPGMLNALHACRSGHPLGKFTYMPFMNAASLAYQRTDIPFLAIDWLVRQAKQNGEIPQ